MLFRCAQFQQMADSGAKDVLLALEVVAMPREAADRSRNVGGNGRFLRDDQMFSHAPCIANAATKRAPDDKNKNLRAQARTSERRRGSDLNHGRQTDSRQRCMR